MTKNKKMTEHGRKRLNPFKSRVAGILEKSFVILSAYEFLKGRGENLCFFNF